MEKHFEEIKILNKDLNLNQYFEQLYFMQNDKLLFDKTTIITKFGLYEEQNQLFIFNQTNPSNKEIWLEQELSSLNEMKY